MEIFKSILYAVIINCCFVMHSKGERITLGDTKEAFALRGKSLLIECLLTSGTLDPTLPRSWRADSTTLISGGNPTSAGSEYSETLGNNSFSLITPSLDDDADGRLYQCNYGFSQGKLTVKIYGIERTDQSERDCINEKLIHNCWFSLEKVIPDVSSQNLTVLYEDGTMDDINSMLNITSTLNADGKTRGYYFKIESASLSKDVKKIKLTFIVGPISRTLTITVKDWSNHMSGNRTDCKLVIRLCGSLPVSLCELITSIVIIILLILKKEPFFKHFGELTKKKVFKVCIIVAFIVVAIIIGLCLGLLIEGICDNIPLALSLSFAFAILLAVTLFVSLFFYHKFESKKDIQDGGAQDGNGSSQNNTGSNTTRTTTERVGSPASTSNVELAANLKSEY